MIIINKRRHREEIDRDNKAFLEIRKQELEVMRERNKIEEKRFVLDRMKDFLNKEAFKEAVKEAVVEANDLVLKKLEGT